MKAIACMTQNRVIGKDNQLVWSSKEDLKFFKDKTYGKPVIMGRNTYESIHKQLGKPLPGRLNIVATKQTYLSDQVLVCNNLDMVHKYPGELWVAGGAQIYKELLPYCDELFLTVVNKEIDGDAFFPEFGGLFKKAYTIYETEEYKRIQYVRE